MTKPTSSSKNNSADNLLSLFNKIPDYSEVKHLGQSDFIRALEQLKEEFRRCRASLYHSSDEDLLERSARNVNIKERAVSPLRKVFNFSSNFQQEPISRSRLLEVKGSQSQLHRNPSAVSGGSGNSYAINYLNYNKPSRSLSFNFEERKDHFRNADEFDSDDDDNTQISDSSKWSSSPDLGAFREFKEYVPPSNIQKRLLVRKAHNQSAPTLSVPEEDKSLVFKAHPVPSHVYKPLYEFIMLKNQRRSQKVREQSKQKLMAQVKPFSFAKEKVTPYFHNKPVSNPERAQSQSASPPNNTGNKEILNNSRPVKSRRGCNTHTNNFKMVNQFRANPAPPRTRALMSAMRLKEQQEYRELKKRLRSEALLKNATLPPSMAARDKRVKLCNAKLDSIIQEYQNTCNSARDKSKNLGDQSTDAEFDDTLTDEDLLSEDSFRYLNSPNNPSAARNKPKKQKNFTPFGKSRHSSAASGIFECTSNDNLASRLRIQATRKKEVERIKREEEELLKLLRNESRRKKLRDSHLAAWRRAHSYSSAQDISMRRQLRMAASILEREHFIRDMSTMLTRVRSAPLLLEGVRERRFEPCKKHKEELGDRLISNNKPTTPRFTPRRNKTSSNWFQDRYGYGEDEPSQSEAAMAEGSLTNSDNETEEDNSEHESDEGGGEKNEIISATETCQLGDTPTPTPRRKKQLRIEDDQNDVGGE